jgi:hypothetical protein
MKTKMGANKKRTQLFVGNHVESLATIVIGKVVSRRIKPLPNYRSQSAMLP